MSDLLSPLPWPPPHLGALLCWDPQRGEWGLWHPWSSPSAVLYTDSISLTTSSTHLENTGPRSLASTWLRGVPGAGGWVPPALELGRARQQGLDPILPAQGLRPLGPGSIREPRCAGNSCSPLDAPEAVSISASPSFWLGLQPYS